MGARKPKYPQATAKPKKATTRRARPGRPSHFEGPREVFIDFIADEYVRHGSRRRKTRMLDRLSLTMARLYGHDLGKCTPDLPLSTIPKGPLRDSEETRQSVFVAMLRKRCRYHLYNRSTAKRTSNTSTIKTILKHNREGKPQGQTPWRRFMEDDFSSSLKQDFETQWSQEKKDDPALSSKQRIAAVGKHVRNIWNFEENAHLREQYTNTVDEEYKAALAEWDFAEEDLENMSAMKFLSALRRFGPVSRQLVDALARWTGGVVILKLVVPVGSQGGAIDVRTTQSAIGLPTLVPHDEEIDVDADGDTDEEDNNKGGQGQTKKPTGSEARMRQSLFSETYEQEEERYNEKLVAYGEMYFSETERLARVIDEDDIQAFTQKKSDLKSEPDSSGSDDSESESEQPGARKKKVVIPENITMEEAVEKRIIPSYFLAAAKAAAAAYPPTAFAQPQQHPGSAHPAPPLPPNAFSDFVPHLDPAGVPNVKAPNTSLNFAPLPLVPGEAPNMEPPITFLNFTPLHLDPVKATNVNGPGSDSSSLLTYPLPNEPKNMEIGPQNHMNMNFHNPKLYHVPSHYPTTGLGNNSGSDTQDYPQYNEADNAFIQSLFNQPEGQLSHDDFEFEKFDEHLDLDLGMPPTNLLRESSEFSFSSFSDGGYNPNYSLPLSSTGSDSSLHRTPKISDHGESHESWMCPMSDVRSAPPTMASPYRPLSQSTVAKPDFPKGPAPLQFSSVGAPPIGLAAPYTSSASFSSPSRGASVPSQDGSLTSASAKKAGTTGKPSKTQGPFGADTDEDGGSKAIPKRRKSTGSKRKSRDDCSDLGAPLIEGARNRRRSRKLLNQDVVDH